MLELLEVTVEFQSGPASGEGGDEDVSLTIVGLIVL